MAELGKGAGQTTRVSILYDVGYPLPPMNLLAIPGEARIDISS